MAVPTFLSYCPDLGRIKICFSSDSANMFPCPVMTVWGQIPSLLWQSEDDRDSLAFSQDKRGCQTEWCLKRFPTMGRRFYFFSKRYIIQRPNGCCYLNIPFPLLCGFYELSLCYHVGSCVTQSCIKIHLLGLQFVVENTFLVSSESLEFYRLVFLSGFRKRRDLQHAKTYKETVDNCFQSIFPVTIS